jgi:beta-fructofuranosidase
MPQRAPAAAGGAGGAAMSGAMRRARATRCPARPAHAPAPTGCFSGCATVDTDGRPVILYTGVRLRTNNEVGPLPPPDRDLNLPFIESQIAATPADPGALPRRGPCSRRARGGRALP